MVLLFTSVFLIYCTICSLHFCLFLGQSHP